MKPARGEDHGADRWLAEARRRGWIWNDCRCGIVAKTPPNAAGRHATTIWYGQHRVTWEMIRFRPPVPKLRQLKLQARPLFEEK